MSYFHTVTQDDLNSGDIIRCSKFHDDIVTDYFDKRTKNRDLIVDHDSDSESDSEKYHEYYSDDEENPVNFYVRHAVSWIVPYKDIKIAIPFEDVEMDTSHRGEEGYCDDYEPITVNSYFNFDLNDIPPVEHFDYMLNRIFVGILGFSNLHELGESELLQIMSESKSSFKSFQEAYTSVVKDFDGDYEEYKKSLR